MVTVDALERGRESFRRQAWADAYSLLCLAGRESDVRPEDLEMLAIAAHLTGHEEESVQAWTRAHNDYLREGNIQRSARCAFWLAFGLLLQGEPAQSSGWVARGRRLLSDVVDCVEHGYLIVPAALKHYWEGEVPVGHELFQRALEIGERFAEPDLIAFSRLGVGEALIQLGKPVEGIALLDEVMAAATAGELSTAAIGVVYCAVISCCHDLFDLRRAREWTDALTKWCASQPDLVPYRGQCLVHRAQLMGMQGAWSDALDEARRACESLSGPGARPWAGAAFYEQGDLHRLRGEFAEAEEAYRQASVWGFAPQPGLALLRLAQRRVDAAATAIRTAVEQAHDLLSRSRLLAGHVEIMLATGDAKAARASADELRSMSDLRDAPLLHAISSQAQGAALLAEGEAAEALAVLRRSWTLWQALEAPYEAARVRVQMALACRAFGDGETAALELSTARQVFEGLGAAPDVARVDGLNPVAAPAKPVGGLTAREVEVMRLVAAGKTNRAIADDLVLSEKTVARHLSNIFAKLGISTRAAATAYAYEHGLR